MDLKARTLLVSGSMRNAGQAMRQKPGAMRLLAVLAGIAVLVFVGACGNSGGVTGTTDTASPAPARSTTTASGRETSTAVNYAKADADHDDDFEAGALDDKNNRPALSFGQAASTRDRREIAALVKRYYAVALSGDGAKGCTMLNSALAEIAVEDYGSLAGPAYARGAKTCHEVLSDVFRFYHARFVAVIPHLKVAAVRLQGRAGYALLRFGPYPERKISVGREGSSWRIAALTDAELQ